MIWSRYTLITSSKLPLCSFSNGIIERIPFPKLVIVVFCLIPFIQIQVVFSKEVIMVLGTHQLVWVVVLALVRVEKGRFVLSQFVIVVFVVKVLVRLGSALGCRLTEIVHDFLKTSCAFGLLRLFLWERRHVDVETTDLFSDVLHGLLHVSLFSVGWKVQGLKWRQSSEHLLEGNALSVFSPDFSTKSLILLNRKFDSMIMYEPQQGIKGQISFHFSINRWNDILESIPILLDELLFQNLNSPIELNFLFKQPGQLPFSSRFHNFVRWVHIFA